MGEYGQTACPLCRTPLFGARDWPVLAAMKTVVASMGVQTALCLLNAQYEIRRGGLLNTVVWVVASCFTVPVFWCVLMYIVIRIRTRTIGGARVRVDSVRLRLVRVLSPVLGLLLWCCGSVTEGSNEVERPQGRQGF